MSEEKKTTGKKPGDKKTRPSEGKIKMGFSSVRTSRKKRRADGKVSPLWKATSMTLTIMGRTVKTIWLILAALILIAVIGIFFLSHIFGNIYTASRQAEYKALETLDENTFKETGKTVIYDKNGGVIATLHNTGYKYVKISEISDAIQKTYISSEDKDFLTHNGFSVKGIGRAAYSLIKSGHIVSGGSTITQQLVKNTLLSSERTFFRKLTEVFLAQDLEKKYTKADIMEYYLNSCFYGNNCKGIYAASEYYFGKKPSEIGYEEAAMLAAISKSPSVYNPEADTKKAIEERNIVLGSLRSDKLITEEEYKVYLKDGYTVREHETEQEKDSYAASFAIYSSAIQLMKADGFKFCYRFSDEKSEKAYEKKYQKAYIKYSNALRNGGYRIYTSIDPSVQETAQETVDKDMLKVSTEKQSDGRYNTQASVTVIDNDTGLVTAIIGGRGTDDEYNRAFLSERQPGSSIKPVLDYGPAFDTGNFYPGRIVSDTKSKNGPKNSEGTYSGNITIRKAIAESKNTVAFDTLKTIGVDFGLSYLEKMQFSSLSYLDEDNLSASIGGFSYGVKNFELAGAYRAIENGGVWQMPTCVIKIKDLMSGNEIKSDRSKVSVYKVSSAYMLVSTMEDVIKHGTGRGLSI
ncbi:MAG: transglycosylase domain-containing protein, partial [Candidatus Weimeria sp.]